MSTQTRNRASSVLETLAAVTLLGVAGTVLAQEQQNTPPPPLAPLTIEGNAERGALLATTCHGCHGIPGYRNAYPSYRVPKLGGQNADYIEVALQGYRRGTRAHVTMQAQASSLTDQDIADLAAFFASVEEPPETGISSGDAAAIVAGQQKSAACVPCHGANGIAQAAQWPNLAGQHQSYLIQALSQYKAGGRQDLVMGPMVAPLDAETIEQLAAYFSSQPGLYTVEDAPPETTASTR